MREKSKPNTGKRGISTANAYRGVTNADGTITKGIKSPCTDIEGLVDAFGAAAIARMCFLIEADIELYGDSINNSEYNAELNVLPFPKIRKQHNSKTEQKALRIGRKAA